MDGKNEETDFRTEGLRFLLSSPVGRKFFVSVLVELCHLYDASAPLNASSYVLGAKRQIGLYLYDLARTMDFEAVQKAEREYRDAVRTCRTLKKEKENA